MPSSNDSVDDEQFFNEEEAEAGSVGIRGDFKCDLSVEGEDVEVIRVPPAANTKVLPDEPMKRKELFRVPPSSTSASARALPAEPPQRKEKTTSRVPTNAIAMPEKRKELFRVPPAAKVVPRLEPRVERVDYNDGGALRLSPTPNTTSASVADSTILAMSMMTMKPEDVPTFLLDCT